MNTDRTAARTAADALASIERWSRASFIVAAVGVIIIAAGGAFTLHEYLALKAGFATAAAQVEKARAELATKFRPGR